MNHDYPTIPEIIEKRNLPPFVFRGYSEDHEWVYGSLTYSYKEDLYYITEWNEEELSFPVEKESIGLWTGRLDVDEQMIFQDQIIKSYFTGRHMRIAFGNYRGDSYLDEDRNTGFFFTTPNAEKQFPFGTTIHDFGGAYRIISNAYKSKIKG